MLDLGGYNHSYAVELEKLRNYLAFFTSMFFVLFVSCACFRVVFCAGTGTVHLWHWKTMLKCDWSAGVRGCPRVSAAPTVWVALSAALVAKTIGERRVCPRRHDLPCPRVSAVLATCVVFFLYTHSLVASWKNVRPQNLQKKTSKNLWSYKST